MMKYAGSLSLVTFRALRRSATVNSDHLTGNFVLLLVALGASHANMETVQRIGRGIVVEGVGIPLADGMTRLAILLAIGRHELAAVHILVALRTLLGSLEETHGVFCVRCGRLMARSAHHGLVRTL